ncbi:TetR/AcrR family transcriptional regulator [Hoeflea poritis]|uniref:TetR/AcrR family transcriptional regulator n=1 Tax=Hoeflea poritis TaxID=2993659 RepID=A0ABT4VQC1_9HYPH|nr:TetR/AcrR family transcriptional regulator [Hoeflea poritis]MDA4846218.1 TetR/AcrR family transcriptional regulator [Hoeflea poritis]
MPQAQAVQQGRARDSRKAILDAAERAFADFGFGGASIRAIARDADVNQAMVHYYYQNKDQLFSAVVERRAGDINERRDLALDALFDNAVPALEDLVEALLRPTIELGHDVERGGDAYARLIVYFNNSADERSQRVAEENYDPIARRSIDALMRVLPGLGRAEAVRGYLFAISVALSVMAKTGRAARLSDGLCDDSNTEETVATVVAFACAGIRALADGRFENRQD